MTKHIARPRAADLVGDIVAPLLAAAEDEVALAAAESIASGEDARITGLYVALMPNQEYAPSSESAPDLWIDARMVDRNERDREYEAIAARLGAVAAKTRLSRLELRGRSSLAELAVHARHADVVIMRRPDAGPDPRRDILEIMLFASGRPVILIPPGWDRGLRAQQVMIAWNGSREAARAIGDAMPWLCAAARVGVVTVDAKSAVAQAADEVRDHLAVHDVRVDVRHIAAIGRSHGEALLTEARLSGADLVVMGGFGHARAMERVFGGATKLFVEQADMPVLLSH